jgi:PAS domain S-box-containing protein
MTPLRILLVDDDLNSTQNLQPRLLKLGYQVVATATTSKEAIDKSAVHKPDIVLMNTRLRSGNDGIKTGKLIHSNYNIPIIYISSQAGQDTIRQAGSTGPFGYIIKPFDDSQLYVSIEIAQIRFKLENQLRENQQWLDGVLMSIGDGVLAVDNTGYIRFINAQAEQITGWGRSEAIGKLVFEVLQLKDEHSGEVLDLSSNPPKGSVKSMHESGTEALLISKNGDSKPLEINFNPIIGKNNEPMGVVFAFRDITHRRSALKQIQLQTNRAEALVKVAEQLNSHIEFKDVLETVCAVTNQLLNTSVSMILLYDPKANLYKNMAQRFEGGHQKSNREAPRIMFSREALQAFLPADHSAFSIENATSQTNIPYRSVLRLLKIRTLAVAPLIRNSDVIGILVCGSPENIRNYPHDELGILDDLANHVTIAISNASLFEQVRNGRERQRTLAKGLVEVQETERQNIARDLHDHFGQSLTGLQFMLESLKHKVDDPIKPELSEIQEYVGDIIAQVREMSLSLRPSILDDIGLVPTLKWHFERFANQTGIKIVFKSDEFPTRFPSEIETTAFRIVQEALTNVARHAQVAEVLVGLALQGDTLLVEVLDKGKGFDASSFSDKPTAGLGGMRERANLVGGFLAINSYLNQGTQILASLPLNNTPIERRKNDRNYPVGR